MRQWKWHSNQLVVPSLVFFFAFWRRRLKFRCKLFVDFSFSCTVGESLLDNYQGHPHLVLSQNKRQIYTQTGDRQTRPIVFALLKDKIKKSNQLEKGKKTFIRHDKYYLGLAMAAVSHLCERTSVSEASKCCLARSGFSVSLWRWLLWPGI